MSTPIEATPVPERAEALAVVSRESGVMALAYLPEADFEARLVALKQGQDRVRRVQRELMEVDEDYGVIPGTKKPTLLKPGAEKLCNVYGLVPTYEKETTLGDGATAPHIRVEMTCSLHRGDTLGPIVGVGVGSANSWERKHRYRGAERSCPSCGCEGTIRRSSYEKDGDKGWYCHVKSGGCGAAFRSDDQQITDQQRGQVDNEDPFDLDNTLLKMARKRAYVDATLTATATSGMFTQDLEDVQGGAAPAAPAPAGAPAAQGQPAPAPRPARPAPAASATRTGATPAGRWTGPCPKCGKAGSVIPNKKDGHGWVCWTGASKPGCGYKFDAEDAAIHREAAEKRAAAGGGAPPDDPFGDSLDPDAPGAERE